MSHRNERTDLSIDHVYLCVITRELIKERYLQEDFGALLACGQEAVLFKHTFDLLYVNIYKIQIQEYSVIMQLHENVQYISLCISLIECILL